MNEKDSLTNQVVPTIVRTLGTLALAVTTALVIKWLFSWKTKEEKTLEDEANYHLDLKARDGQCQRDCSSFIHSVGAEEVAHLKVSDFGEKDIVTSLNNGEVCVDSLNTISLSNEPNISIHSIIETSPKTPQTLSTNQMLPACYEDAEWYREWSTSEISPKIKAHNDHICPGIHCTECSMQHNSANVNGEMLIPDPEGNETGIIFNYLETNGNESNMDSVAKCRNLELDYKDESTSPSQPKTRKTLWNGTMCNTRSLVLSPKSQLSLLNINCWQKCYKNAKLRSFLNLTTRQHKSMGQDIYCTIIKEDLHCLKSSLMVRDALPLILEYSLCLKVKNYDATSYRETFLQMVKNTDLILSAQMAHQPCDFGKVASIQHVPSDVFAAQENMKDDEHDKPAKVQGHSIVGRFDKTEQIRPDTQLYDNYCESQSFCQYSIPSYENELVSNSDHKENSSMESLHEVKHEKTFHVHQILEKIVSEQFHLIKTSQRNVNVEAPENLLSDLSFVPSPTNNSPASSHQEVAEYDQYGISCMEQRKELAQSERVPSPPVMEHGLYREPSSPINSAQEFQQEPVSDFPLKEIIQPNVLPTTNTNIPGDRFPPGKTILSIIAEDPALRSEPEHNFPCTKEAPLVTKSFENIYSQLSKQSSTLKSKAQSMFCLLSEYYSSTGQSSENGPVEKLSRGCFVRIPKSLQHLGKTMRFQLTLGNCIELLKVARKNSIPELINAVYTVISDNFLHVLKNPAIYGQLTGSDREQVLGLRMRGKSSLCIIEMKSIFDWNAKIQTSEDSPPKGQLYALDMEKNQWRTLSSIPEEASLKGSSICSMHNYLFIAGGIQKAGESSTCSNKLFCYNPLTDIWSQLTPMNQARSQLKLIALDGYLYAIGGECLHTVEKYDPRLNKWTFTAPMPNGLFAVAHEAVACGGDIFISGGHLFYRLLKYSPPTDQWEECPFNASKGRSCDMVALGNVLYRFDIHRDSKVGIFKYNTITKSWSEYTAIFPGSKMPFRCTVIDGAIYCLNGETTTRCTIHGEEVMFESAVYTNFPARGKGFACPVVLNLPGAVSQTCV